jgi:GntR family transcriptional regulator
MSEMSPSEVVRNRFAAALPLYIQIAEGLLDRIESGELSPGDRLPSERELSDMLSVNRLTLRRSLQMLESQGLIIRRQGDGTYVAEPKIERQAGQLVPFTRGMQRRGYTPSAKVLTFDQKPAEAAVAKELNLLVGAPVYYIHRLRFINREPVLLEKVTLPLHRVPELEQFNLEERSLYEILETEYEISVCRARQSLEPVVATEYEAEVLGIMLGAPLMLEHRLGFDKNDQMIEHARDLYRGDRFRFITEFAPLE